MRHLELRPAEPEYEVVQVTNNAERIFSPDKSVVEMELPAGMDLEEAWRQYEACGGRVYIQDGNVLDHDTVDFVDWLRHHGARSLSA